MSRVGATSRFLEEAPAVSTSRPITDLIPPGFSGSTEAAALLETRTVVGAAGAIGARSSTELGCDQDDRILPLRPQTLWCTPSRNSV